MNVFHNAKAKLGLSLHDNKEKALIDYLVCLPQILSSIVTPSNVRAGFYQNGTIATPEPSQYACPCFDGMMATCRKVQSAEVMALCKEAFPAALDQAILSIRDKRHTRRDLPNDGTNNKVVHASKKNYKAPTLQPSNSQVNQGVNLRLI
jgi:hypothetical protein